MTSVLSQKFADKASPLRATVPEPRQGRKPWGTEPSPRLRHPSPARAGEGMGVREGSLTHGSRRGLPSFVRSAG